MIQTDQGIKFFGMAESIEMICVSSPSPILLTTLLKISKRTRKLIWNYLIDYNQCTKAWCDIFLKELYEIRIMRPKNNVVYNSLHPTFVVPKVRFSSDNYYIGKIVINKYKIEFGEADVLIGEYYSHDVRDELSYPGWELDINLKISDFFEWYFVALALSIRLDRMIIYNDLRRGLDGGIVQHDTTLYIT